MPAAPASTISSSVQPARATEPRMWVEIPKGLVVYYARGCPFEALLSIQSECYLLSGGVAAFADIS